MKTNPVLKLTKIGPPTFASQSVKPTAPTDANAPPMEPPFTSRAPPGATATEPVTFPVTYTSCPELITRLPEYVPLIVCVKPTTSVATALELAAKFGLPP
jgi:hypothetical protein